MSKLVTNDNLKAYHAELAEHIKLLQRNTAYVLDDIVNYDGITLKCTTAGTTNTTKPSISSLAVGSTYTDGTCVWTRVDLDKRGIDYWASSTTYALNDQVVYDNKIYKCSTVHTSISTFDATKWTEISAGGGGSIDEWTSGTSYSSGDVVIKDNVLYKANTTTSTTWVDSEWNIIGTNFNSTSTYVQKIVTNVVAPYEMLLQVGDSNYCKPPIDVLKKTGGSDNVTLTLENYNNPSAYTGTSDFLKIVNSKAKLYNYKEYPITPQTLSTIDIGVSDEIDFNEFYSPIPPLDYIIRVRADSSGIHDLAGNTWTNAGVTTSTGKFSGNSLNFNSAQMYTDVTSNMVIPADADFTVSFWAKVYSSPVFGYAIADDVDNGISISPWSESNKIFYALNSSVGQYITTLVSLNTWNHLAMTRKDGIVRCFYNGELVYIHSTAVNEPVYANSNIIGLGGWGTTTSSNRLYKGYLDDVCIIRGQALWTETFTPPTDYLPNSIEVNYNISSLEVN